MILPILLTSFVLFFLPGGQVLQSKEIGLVLAASAFGFIVACAMQAVLVRAGTWAHFPGLIVLLFVLLEQFCPWPGIKTAPALALSFGFLVSSWYLLDHFQNHSTLKRLSYLKKPSSSIYGASFKLYLSSFATWIQLGIVLSMSLVFLKQFPPFQFETEANLIGSILYLCMASVCVLRRAP